MKALGIDVGSLTTKAVVLGGDGIVASTVSMSSDEAEDSARSALEQVLNRAGIGMADDLCIVATGVGRKAVSFSQQQKATTTCLARGTHFLFPTARMVIDMGAETSTVLKMNQRGRVEDWAGQDKCAAGSGIFLQQMARLMQMSLEEMSELSLQATSRASITSTCAVFAESEVISHVHREPPTPREEIIAGIYYSVVSRIMALCKRVGVEKDVAVAGGVSLSNGVVRTLETELGFGALVPEQPQIVSALGAAVLAGEMAGQVVK
ncbi:MAG: acyl-CoA dehydratase activase [Chloroflexota bacterium]|nr:acyl-CoA dehydratase activase [Chloroflexota bacterium]